MGVFYFKVSIGMPTIAQAQATFNQSGGGAGSYSVKVKNEGKTITFPESFKALGVMEAMLAEYIGEFLTKAADNLNEKNSTSSGSLEESLTFQITPSGGGYVVNFLANDYYKFVDMGVRGVGPGNKNTSSEYSFKNAWPSKNHIAAIQKWMKDNNMTARAMDVSRYGAVGRERKARSRPSNRSAAFFIARAIKIRGLPATNFWTDAFDQTFADFGQKMSQALGVSLAIDLKRMGESIKGNGVFIPKK